MTPTLTQLADRLEAASGDEGSRYFRVIEAQIYQRMGGLAWWGYNEPDGYPSTRNEVPHYTSNLDAAMTLVPDGHTFNCGNDVRPWAHVWFDVPAYDGQPYAANGATVALALAAACLRALAAENDALKVEVERLRERLEIPEPPFEDCDGIDCRDETIRGQDATISTLRAQLATARREGMEEAARIAKTCELYNDIDQRLHSDIRETCSAAILAAIEHGAHQATR